MKKELIDAAKEYIYQLDEFLDSQVIGQIKIELDSILDLDSDEVLKMRQAHFGIGKKNDYKHQWIKTCEGYVLAGIRHTNGNPNKPFVFVWPSFKINDHHRVFKEISPYFRVFKPKHYNIWIRPDQNDYKDAQVFQQRFIGVVSDLENDHLELTRPKNYYNWYEKEHNLFIKEKQDLLDRVTINSKEMMDDCLNQKLLFQYVLHEHVIGLVAGERDVFMGLDSIYLDEIIVASDYRRKGFGKKILSSFIGNQNVKYVTCHIDIENIGSTRIALKLGEKVFSQELFFRLD